MHEINEKQRKFAINFIMYFFCFIFVCIVGISNVFGLEYINIGNYADITVVLISTDYGDAPFTVPKDSAYNFTQVLEIDYHVNNFNFEANKNYQLESHLTQQQLTNANYYTVQGLNGEQCLISYDNSYFTGAYPRWAFQCPHATNSITLSIKNSNNQYLWASGQTNIFTWTSALLKYSTTSLSGNDSSNDSIINNQNQNTQNIINNQNQNTQNIINNNNENAQKIIESNKVCEMIDNNFVGHDTKYLDNEGNEIYNPSYIISNYFSISSTSELKVLTSYSSNAAHYCFYNVNKSLISCNSLSTLSVNSNVIIPNNASFFRSSILKSQNKPTFKLCKNGSQAINETNKGIFSKIKELFSWFSNDEDADISGLNNMVGWLPPGPVDSIINLPLAFFNALTNTLSGTCQDVSLTLPFVNQTLVLPCFDSYMTQYLQHFGIFWTLVGSIVSIFILYNYLLALYKWVDDTLTFRENNLPGYYGDNWGGGA